MERQDRGPSATQYSGVAVRVRADRFDPACEAIDDIPGVEVRLRHPDGERLIAVIESRDEAGQVESLRRVREIPGVLVAAPVFHLVDDPGQPGSEGDGTTPVPERTGDP